MNEMKAKIGIFMKEKYAKKSLDAIFVLINDFFAQKRRVSDQSHFVVSN